MEALLGEGWTRGTYGSNHDGWLFSDKYGNRLAYHRPGGIHKSGYYIYKKANVQGRIKLIGLGYNPMGEKKIIKYIHVNMIL